jgi:hypothetical protein
MYDNNYQRTLKHESDSDEEQKQSLTASAFVNPLRSPLDINSQNPLGGNNQQV